MIGSKTSLALHAWFTTVITWGFDSILSSFTFYSSFKSFLPGIAVATSYFILIFVSWLSIPSIAEIKLKRCISKSRKSIKGKLKGKISKAHRAHLNKELESLDLKELEQYEIKFKALSKELEVEASSDNVES
ncbi:hypothetical protein BFS14_14565 [Serratia fonticola]|uniref:hypothetical protein n=1 Tax=Serratia fonticola TaxID=47917 RepID=UPI0008FD5A8D|nr:hypothetical protein [Serratia fonticola]OIX95585.1 hypothetical protein BFS14_14565 [Serratia fonticola]QCR62097.1 hypothetical protein FD644_17825 [Serratia fonticola]